MENNVRVWEDLFSKRNLIRWLWCRVRPRRRPPCDCHKFQSIRRFDLISHVCFGRQQYHKIITTTVSLICSTSLSSAFCPPSQLQCNVLIAQSVDTLFYNPPGGNEGRNQEAGHSPSQFNKVEWIGWIDGQTQAWGT